MSSALIRRSTVLLFLSAGLWWTAPAAIASAGSWVAPLPEPLAVTRSFDPPANPYGAGHRGVDLAGAPGQEVRAAGAGTVVYAGLLAGRGVVSVQHADGLRTTYEPVLASVAAGMPLSLGQVVGTLEAGHAGCPGPACLHWGLKRGESYLDPMLLLDQGPVRLLPRYGAARSAGDLASGLATTAGPLAVGVLGLGLVTRRRRLQAVRRVDALVGRPP
ncbi:MAG: M23 family metallopeptidase [Geodermatophilaceae bacterium]